MPSGTRATTWIPLDVRFPRHRKVVRLSRELRYRHIEALCLCREMDNGGHLSREEVDDLMRDLTPRKRVQAVDALVEAGLWDQNGSGWYMHDWDDWNDALDERRARDRERKREERRRKREVDDA